MNSFDLLNRFVDMPIFESDGPHFWTKTKNMHNVFLSGVVHGDEPVGIYALLKFFEEYKDDGIFNFYLAPCVNWYGFENNQANNRENFNLNRSFYNETQAWEAWMLMARLEKWNRKFLFAMDLHEIPHYWEDEGWKSEDNPVEAYLYETQKDVSKRIGRKILDSVSVPLCQWPTIYGDKAEDGLITYPEGCGNPHYAEGTSLDAYLNGRYTDHTFTTETPTHWDLDERVRVQVGWIKAALANITAPRRYLCERCGGYGIQPEGCYDLKTKSYTAKAGVCETCDGEGYLGVIGEK